jgi:hypothetical protein
MAQKTPKKKNNKFIKILIVVVLIGGIFFFVNKNFAESAISFPNEPTSQSSNLLWWNSEYSYRKKLEINLDKKGFIEFNHAALNVDLKSNDDGSDIVIIGNTDEKFTEIPYEYDRFGQITTKIAFDPSIFIYKNYFLYYGNKALIGKKYINAKQSPISMTNKFELKEEEKVKIVITSTKKWVLTDSEDISRFSIKVSSDKPITDVYYQFEGENENKKASMEQDSFHIDLSKRKPGNEKLIVAAFLDGKLERSNTLSIFITKPIYIAWTLDWEGVDPTQEYLDMIEDLSSEYEVKLTHFFNPRIMINMKINSARKKELVNWVLNRHNNLGEEIAMHLHMHYDMVEEAGVKAKYDAPTWDKGVTGYDTPSTAYSYSEYLKILQWGKNKMLEAGLPSPEGFRAGGWFANLETLKAMQDAGFTYDSSARIPFPIGQNKLSQSWDISTKTQPYMISQSDQSKDTEPTLNLLEIPNNGLDSYWSEADTLIQNFYDNYSPGTIAENSRLVTFLSHPEWFYIDEPRLKELFEEVSKFRSDLDLGPVKFVTLSEWRKLNNK